MHNSVFTRWGLSDIQPLKRYEMVDAIELSHKKWIFSASIGQNDNVSKEQTLFIFVKEISKDVP
jgi:hypothetical protein